jgi:hypothetical protein
VLLLWRVVMMLTAVEVVLKRVSTPMMMKWMMVQR